MSDGSPYQMSHFREQLANIGLMDPALAPGQTFCPAYYSTADVTISAGVRARLARRPIAFRAPARALLSARTRVAAVASGFARPRRSPGA